MCRLPVLKTFEQSPKCFVELRHCKFGHIWGQANVGGIVFYKHQLRSVPEISTSHGAALSFFFFVGGPYYKNLIIKVIPFLKK